MTGHRAAAAVDLRPPSRTDADTGTCPCTVQDPP